MKRRTSMIIGIATAIITVVGLNAAFGSKYRMQHGFYHHHFCMQEKRPGDNAITPQSGSANDSSIRK